MPTYDRVVQYQRRAVDHQQVSLPQAQLSAQLSACNCQTHLLCLHVDDMRMQPIYTMLTAASLTLCILSAWLLMQQ